jgi:antitoxin MazE
VAAHLGREYYVITPEVTSMKSRLVRIGNSRGVRLPKPLIEEAGLSDEVEIRARQGSIIILPAAGVRSGWSEAARQLRARSEDRLLDDAGPTRFDEQEWTW